jgi:hypothetical protein
MEILVVGGPLAVGQAVLPQMKAIVRAEHEVGRAQPAETLHAPEDGADGLVHGLQGPQAVAVERVESGDLVRVEQGQAEEGRFVLNVRLVEASRPRRDPIFE